MITNIINEVNHPQSFILFGEREDLEMFNELYKSIMKYMRKGWYVHHVIYNSISSLILSSCSCLDIIVNDKGRDSPLYVNVQYNTGKLYNFWFDSLSASFAGLQVSND